MTMILYQQQTPFSCGQAALRCVASAFNINFDEYALAKYMGASPGIGTDNKEMLSWARKYLPVLDRSDEEYNGEGVCIANIRNPVSGNGHYVVMLGANQKQYKYYCPLLHDIVKIKKSELDWRNSSGDLVNWHLYFPRQPQDYLLLR